MTPAGGVNTRSLQGSPPSGRPPGSPEDCFKTNFAATFCYNNAAILQQHFDRIETALQHDRSRIGTGWLQHRNIVLRPL